MYLNEKKPSAFMLENVRMLTVHDDGRTFHIIKKHLVTFGLHIHAKLLNALDFGVPQKKGMYYYRVCRACRFSFSLPYP